MGGSTKDLVTLAAVGIASGGAGFALAPAGAAAGAATTGVVTSAVPLGASLGASVFTASNLAIAAGGLSAASSIFSGISAAGAAKSQQAQAELQQSAERTQQAAEDLARQRRLRAVQSAQRAAFGASGALGASGLNIEAQSIAEAGLEAQQSGAASGVRQGVFGLNARSAGRAATKSLITGLASATTTGLKTARSV